MRLQSGAAPNAQGPQASASNRAGSSWLWRASKDLTGSLPGAWSHFLWLVAMWLCALLLATQRRDRPTCAAQFRGESLPKDALCETCLNARYLFIRVSPTCGVERGRLNDVSPRVALIRSTSQRDEPLLTSRRARARAPTASAAKGRNNRRCGAANRESRTLFSRALSAMVSGRLPPSVFSKHGQRQCAGAHARITPNKCMAVRPGLALSCPKHLSSMSRLRQTSHRSRPRGFQTA